jgi:hypothetical protein
MMLQKVLESPKEYMEIEMPVRPINKIGLRPTRSERRLQ